MTIKANNPDSRRRLAAVRRASRQVRLLARQMCQAAAFADQRYPVSLSAAKEGLGAFMRLRDIDTAYHLSVAALSAALADGARPLQIAYAEAEARLARGWKP